MDKLHGAVGRATPGSGLRGAPRWPAAALGAVWLAAAAACAPSEASAPLAHTFASPERLAQAVVDALARSDRTMLTSLALSEAEFRTYVWPHLPASRPERGVPVEFAWGQMHGRSQASLAAMLARHAGRRLEVTGVRFLGETTDYGAITVSRKAEVRVRNAGGRERRLRLFGSVVRRSGRYKLFSYVVD